MLFPVTTIYCVKLWFTFTVVEYVTVTESVSAVQLSKQRCLSSPAILYVLLLGLQLSLQKGTDFLFISASQQ